MPKTILDELLRKPVEIKANGFIYRGILIEAAPHEVVLRRPAGFVTIRMDRIVSVRDPSARRKGAAPRFVDRSFYTADLPLSPSDAPRAPEAPRPGPPKRES